MLPLHPGISILRAASTLLPRTDRPGLCSCQRPKRAAIVHGRILIKRPMNPCSHECVINVPTNDLVNEVIGIGNCSGAEVHKFKAFELTPAPATNVNAPLVLCEF